jgi:hypothetical protein
MGANPIVLRKRMSAVGGQQVVGVFISSILILFIDIFKVNRRISKPPNFPFCGRTGFKTDK